MADNDKGGRIEGSGDDFGSYIQEMKKRMDASQPRLFSTNSSYQHREAARDILPKGATLALPSRSANSFLGGSLPMGTSLLGGGGGSAQFHLQQPYLPEMASDDRQHYPQDRKRANFYWRLFHKFDPFFGTAVDMYTEMLVSKFDLVIKEDSSKEIRDTLEHMVEEVNFLDRLRYINRDYMVLGEVFPQLFWSDDLGIWTYIGFHNPDNIEVKDAPIINMDPIINFLPDDALRMMLTDGSVEAMELRQRLPSEFVAKVMARQKIRLSPINCSFLARKLHPYDVRGTSLGSRLWRIWMVEDAVFSSTIATFRRNASPLKIVKLGDPTVGWIPDPSQETRLMDLLARAEMDSQSWLVWNYGINFEAFGTNERAVTIGKEHDVIERIKLVALGLSKGFMTGEVSFAAVKGGLQVFLRRLLSLRQFYESIWIYPKFFKPVAQMNDWKKSRPSELTHRYRVKRTAQEIEEENQYIVPEIVWKNRLDPKADTDLLGAYNQLKGAGFIVSKATMGTAAGLDWEEELESSLKEFKREEELKQTVLGEAYKKKYEEEQAPKPGAKPPGGAGAGAMPPGAKGKPPSDGGGAPGAGEKTTPLDEGIEAPGEGGPPLEVGG